MRLCLVIVLVFYMSTHVRLMRCDHKGAVAMIQVAIAPFNFSYCKTFDIKPKAMSVGSNENLP